MKKDTYYLQNNLVPPRNYNKSDVYTLYSNSGTTYFDKAKFKKLINTSTKLNSEGKLEKLNEKLQELGYKKTRHYFTILECELIFSFIGNPILTPKNVDYLILKRLIRQEQFEEFNINFK